MSNLLTKQASSMEELLANALSMEQLLANPSKIDNKHPTHTPSNKETLLWMMISGINKIMTDTLTPPLVWNELNRANPTFDTDGIPSTNDTAGNNNRNVDANNNGIVDNTSKCSDVIGVDIHNNNKVFYFGTLDKVHYGDNILPFVSKDSNSVNGNNNAPLNINCSIISKEMNIFPLPNKRKQVPRSVVTSPSLEYSKESLPNKGSSSSKA